MIFNVKKQAKTGDTLFSKKFAWVPTKIVEPSGDSMTIWLSFFYEKRVFTETPFMSGWYIYRSLTPFKEPPKLSVIKDDDFNF